MKDLDLVPLVGLGMSLVEYCATYLEGEVPYFEDEALRFECTQCGACCERPGVIYMEDEDIARIAEHLKISVEEVQSEMLTQEGGLWVIKVTRSRQCRFYVDKKCTIHDIKPLQCKSYPFWPENVCTRADWLEVKPDCEGIDKGRSYDAETVRRILVGLEAP